jgi:hypothetical protein
MSFSFHPEAETEFLEAIEYYEERERGLGYDFSIEVYATIRKLSESQRLSRSTQTKNSNSCPPHRSASRGGMSFSTATKILSWIQENRQEADRTYHLSCYK